MGAYLSIVSGAIKFLNYIAGALQQHHDELNGARAQVLTTTQDELAAVVKADKAAADPAQIAAVTKQYEISGQ